MKENYNQDMDFGLCQIIVIENEMRLHIAQYVVDQTQDQQDSIADGVEHVWIKNLQNYYQGHMMIQTNVQIKGVIR